MRRNGMSHEQAGREGGIARAMNKQARIVSRYDGLPRELAIYKAWVDGRHAGKVAKRRAA